MADLSFNIRFLLTGLCTLSIISCSASSSSKRYSPKNNTSPNGHTQSVRFTSEEEFDQEPPADADLNASEVSAKFRLKTVAAKSISPKEKMLIDILKFVNTPYQFGGDSKEGIDCSGFTQKIFSETVNVDLPRTASRQFKSGISVATKAELKFGDLLFFNTTGRTFPGHVGIYLGDGLFAHSSSSKGVTVSNFNSNYYKTKYVGARRYLSETQIR